MQNKFGIFKFTCKTTDPFQERDDGVDWENLEHWPNWEVVGLRPPGQQAERQELKRQLERAVPDRRQRPLWLVEVVLGWVVRQEQLFPNSLVPILVEKKWAS